MSTFLFGVKPWDPGVFVLIPMLLTLIGLVAISVPALRATRVDPIKALRLSKPHLAEVIACGITWISAPGLASSSIHKIGRAHV